MIRVKLGTGANAEVVTIDRCPDSCPQCHFTGKQEQFSSPMEMPVGSLEPSLWIPMVCPVERCGRPYFAVYQRRHSPTSYEPDYTYWYATPYKPRPHDQNQAIAALSKNFYSVLDQASAAEDYGLTLIAGMGYRKALEFLVKDYVETGFARRKRAAIRLMLRLLPRKSDES
jgi:hypothetical protein